MLCRFEDFVVWRVFILFSLRNDANLSLAYFPFQGVFDDCYHPMCAHEFGVYPQRLGLQGQAVAALPSITGGEAQTLVVKRTPEQVITDARKLVEALTAKNAKQMKEKLLKLLS